MASHPVKISQIKHKMINIQVTGKIEGKRLLYNLSRKHAVAFLTDETGRILINLWRDQVDQVEDGDTVYLIGAFTKKVKGGLTLSTWEERIQKEKPKIFGK